jgi:hypothetical protein
MAVSKRPKNFVSKKQRVLNYLTARKGEWVPGYKLTAQRVGGTDGLTRLREARRAGMPIELQKNEQTGIYEYRIV